MRARLLAIALLTIAVGNAASAQEPQSFADWTLSTIFTAIIAVALIALAIGVWRLIVVTARCCGKESDKTIRGYLFPLAPALYKEGSGGAYILTKLGNFGRTPCILKESYLESIAAEPTGGPAGRLLMHDMVFDVKAEDVSLSAPALPINGATTSYLIGYFRHLDVFGASHMTRYCYRIEPAIASFERAGGAAWNEFD
ncbi:MAG TPA: hypothetical protein VFE34_15995 [Dongiaceae bacterium]|jgi:hypothetical protein|nr:hypothetical protein [Dongiaceae bacterium]